MPVHRTRDSLSLPAHALEVNTDAPPQPPSLTIISPTPRAFTFPGNLHDATPRASDFQHNLQEEYLAAHHHDKLAESPKTPTSAATPFEPDLSYTAFHRFRQPSPSELSPVSSVDSPISPLSAVASSIQAGIHHQRRSSLSSISLERKPKKGDEDYIKRPENAFILFRRECCMQKNAKEAAAMESGTPAQRRQRQADLSKSISQQWKQLSPEERAYWDERAKQRKKEHEEMYPWYVYQPTRTKERRKSPSKSRKGSRSTSSNASSATDSSMGFTSESDEFFADTEDSESMNIRNVDGPLSMSFVLPSARRASSAPTPPPGYPTIKIPTLFTPSCPSSPALVAIARQSGQTRLLTTPEVGMHYGYLPTGMEMAQSMHQQYGAGAESMDVSGAHVPSYSNFHSLYQNVYDMSNPSVQLSDRTAARPLTSINIPSTPPTQRQHQQPFSASSQTFSPTSSPSTNASTSSIPSTPHRTYQNPQQYYVPGIGIRTSASVTSSPLAGPSSSSAPISMTMLQVQAEKDNQETDVDIDWSKYGLPDWAVPTLWAPDMSSSGFIHYSDVLDQNENEKDVIEGGSGDGGGGDENELESLIDLSNIPSLSLDHFQLDQSTTTHDYGSLPDYPDDIVESLAGMQFPFEDLLHASQF